MAGQSEYTSAQIIAMQKDAMRRVHEMQRISQEKIRQSQPNRPPSPPAPAPEPAAEMPAAPEVSSSLLGPPENKGNEMAGFFDQMNLDPEVLLLLGVGLLLMNEGADPMLLLALLYILL